MKVPPANRAQANALDRPILEINLSVLDVAADPRVSMPVVPEGFL